MSFIHPEFLYLMLPPLFILFALLLTQREAQADFFSKEVFEKLRVNANTLTLKARNALFFLIGFFIIIALAQPVIDDGEIEIKAKSADVMVALDISDSMLAGDIYPNRLEFAKEKAKEFLKTANNERFGVIAFAKNSYLVSPLSFDTNAVRFLLENLQVTSITEQGTNFLAMLDVVDKSLDKEGKKYLLILSDGGDEEDFSKEIAHAKKNNIVVFILGFGTSKGAPVQDNTGSFIKDKNQEILISKRNDAIAALATSTGGVFIEAVKSNADIEAMYAEIKRIADVQELKSQKIHKYIPLFYFPLGLALVILLIATSSMSKREVVHVPSFLLFLGLFFVNPKVDALVFDFLDVQEAKKAYEEGNYPKASELYANHAQQTNNSQSHYNAGNAFYKQQKYDEAIKHYENTQFDDKKMQSMNYANLGNAHAKKATLDALVKAKENYEKSLKLVEDKEVAENLERIKKLLEEQQQKNEAQKNGQNDKEQKDKKQDSTQDKTGQNDTKESQDTEGSDTSQEQKKQQDQKNQSNKTSDENDGQNKSQKPEEAQEEKEKTGGDTQKKVQEKDEDTNATQGSTQQATSTQVQMSEEELQKWLGRLNEKSTTYVYRLNQDTPLKEEENAKPW